MSEASSPSYSVCDEGKKCVSLELFTLVQRDRYPVYLPAADETESPFKRGGAGFSSRNLASLLRFSLSLFNLLLKTIQVMSLCCLYFCELDVSAAVPPCPGWSKSSRAAVGKGSQEEEAAGGGKSGRSGSSSELTGGGSGRLPIQRRHALNQEDGEEEKEKEKEEEEDKDADEVRHPSVKEEDRDVGADIVASAPAAAWGREPRLELVPSSTAESVSLLWMGSLASDGLWREPDEGSLWAEAFSRLRLTRWRPQQVSKSCRLPCGHWDTLRWGGRPRNSPGARVALSARSASLYIVSVPFGAERGLERRDAGSGMGGASPLVERATHSRREFAILRNGGEITHRTHQLSREPALAVYGSTCLTCPLRQGEVLSVLRPEARPTCRVGPPTCSTGTGVAVLSDSPQIDGGVVHSFIVLVVVVLFYI